MLTIDPWPADSMCGIANFARIAGATVSTRSVSSHSSHDASVIRVLILLGDALFTSTVSPPSRLTLSSTSWRHASSLRRSAGTNSACRSAATLPPRSASRPETTTLAPSAINRRAISTPSPDVDPVTIASSPLNRLPIFVPPSPSTPRFCLAVAARPYHQSPRCSPRRSGERYQRASASVPQRSWRVGLGRAWRHAPSSANARTVSPAAYRRKRELRPGPTSTICLIRCLAAGRRHRLDDLDYVACMARRATRADQGVHSDETT